MSVPFIPELSLGTVETGGGWGVGEQFARLPPASLQAVSRVPLYTVGPERDGDNPNDLDGDSSTQASAADDMDDEEAVEVPTTQFTLVSAEDDNTFVDHGSTMTLSPSLKDTHTSKANDSSNVNISGGGEGSVYGGPSKQDSSQQPAFCLKFSRCVSRMIVKQDVRAMAVAPDGGSLWVAFGDDPVTLLDFKGVELNVNRTVDVTQVSAVGVVHVPAAKAVTFKPSSHATHRAGPGNARRSQPKEVGEEQTYALWCGNIRGSIVIVDLTDFSVAGVIRNAHTQTINGLWQIGHGKVWTAGHDKALRVWDPQTRCRTKSRNIATIISGLCYVSSCKQVWTISDDPYIRVFDVTGNNVVVAKQSPDKPENALRMRGEMHFIEYYGPANLIYVSLTRGLAAIDPTTCEILVNINLTITSMTFLGNTALVTGHGELLQCTKDSIGLIDLSDPYCPALLFRGAALGGKIMPVGMRLLTAVPFAVAAQEAGRSERFLTVFNYEDSKAFCRGGSLASVPQQRKITVETPSTRRPVTVTQQNSVVTTGQSSAMSVLAQNPVVFATGKRGAMVRQESTSSNLNPPRTTVVVPRVDNNGSLATTFKTVYSNNNNNNSNNNDSGNSVGGLNGNTDRNVAVQLTTSPEVMTSLTNIEKEVEDLKGLFTHMRTSRPLLDDFSRLHAQVSHLAMNNQLGPNLDADSMEKIGQIYQTLEGRVIASAVERLQRGFSVLPPHSTPHPACPQESAGKHVAGNAGNSAGNAGNNAGVTSQLTLTENHLSSMRDVIGGCIADQTDSLCGSEIPLESLLRWVAQITRSGQSERESHRRRLESLQRHNTRIVERNAAFINGVARMEQALRTHAQRLLEEADAAAAMSSDMGRDSSSHVHVQRHVQLLNQSLQQIDHITVSSSPKEISEAFNSLITLNLRLLSAQQFVHVDEATRRVILNSLSSQAVNDLDGDVVRATPSNGCVSVTDCLHSPRPAAAVVVSMRPHRMRSLIEDQITSVEEFIKGVGKFWCCMEETEGVIYMPYEGGEKPDLFQDFMQLAVLWHLREAQVMVDVCRKESIMAMVEVLLSDIESRESAEEEKNILGEGTTPLASSVISADRTPRESAKDIGTPVTPAGAATTVLKSDSARLVSIGLELESVASRIRKLFRKAERKFSKGIAEAIGGFFLISGEKLHVNATRLRGMLHWERVTMHLLFECLECLENLVFHGDEQPRVFRKDNFKVMDQQVDDWRLCLENIHEEATQLRGVVLSSQRDGASGRRQAHGGHQTAPGPRDGGRRAAGRGSQWVLLFELYVQYAERTDTTPTLFVSHDPNDAVAAADFGLMALFDEIADMVETVRAKSAALLLYCQKVQSRLSRLIEDVVVTEESGQVLIPAFRGGPVEERYCKGFCHDMS